MLICRCGAGCYPADLPRREYWISGTDITVLEHWQPGQSITLRGVWRQKLWFAGPARVVVDSPSLIALYWSAGMVSKIPRERATAQTFLNKNDPELVDHLWVETDVLALNVPGESNSIYVMWETGTKKLRCWYVNLEEPLQRTAIGFDTMDYELDIVINPDKSGWRWKDEESFEEMVRVGLFSPSEAQAIRAEGMRAVHKLEANQSPFCDGWEHWSPPASWTIPVLSPHWEVLKT